MSRLTKKEVFERLIENDRRNLLFVENNKSDTPYFQEYLKMLIADCAIRWINIINSEIARSKNNKAFLDFASKNFTEDQLYLLSEANENLTAAIHLYQKTFGDYE
jgi:hypothetical protein